MRRGHELKLLNRNVSRKYPEPGGARVLTGDVHGDEVTLSRLLGGTRFDVVVDWIAYTPEDIERDLRLFKGRTSQFVFISSASAYQKSPAHYLITEENPLENSFWSCSRNKIACEERLMREHRRSGFPVTIVRPSLTYGPSQIPLCVGSWQHPYTIIDRIKKGRKIIIPGVGTSLWVLTWSGDFDRGLLGLLGGGQAIGQAYHITSDEVLTWNQIYGEVGRAVGKDLDIVHVPSGLIAAYDPEATGSLIGDKANSAVFDNRKIKQLVPDFICSVPWSEGLRRAIAWHEADPLRCSIDNQANGVCDRIIGAFKGAYPKKINKKGRMEGIHPPAGLLPEESAFKNHPSSRKTSGRMRAMNPPPHLAHPAFPPTGMASMFSVGTSFQADSGLII